MLLPFAVEKIPVSRVIAGEVVYNNRYVVVVCINLVYFLLISFTI